MDDTMSTTKEKEVIWGENDSTTHQKKFALPLTNDVCDTIFDTNGSNESGHLLDTITTKTSGIYKIINRANGKYYVGSSRNIKQRWESHRYYLTRNTHSNLHLQAAWNKYGKEKFFIEIINRIDASLLLDTEQLYLDNAKLEHNKCYNITYVAGGGWDFPPEIMEKIKRNHKYYKGSENQRYGTHLSENTKLKISLRLKGKKHSAETRLKMRKSKLGIKRSAEFCIKNSINNTGDKNPNYNHTVYTFFNKNTQETCEDTMCHFYSKYKLNQPNVLRLIQKKGVKSVKGWIII
jgi:group I intron endonuclease